MSETASPIKSELMAFKEHIMLYEFLMNRMDERADARYLMNRLAEMKSASEKEQEIAPPRSNSDLVTTMLSIVMLGLLVYVLYRRGMLF